MNSPEDTTPVDELVRDAAPGSFAPGFADRVMARVDEERRHEFEDAVSANFRWLAAAATLACATLAAWGAVAGGAADSVLFAARDGSEEPTLESVYADALVDPVTLLESGDALVGVER